MGRVCIVTDCTAQFTRANFPGDELVYSLPYHTSPDPEPGGENPSPASQRSTPPTEVDYLKFYTSLSLKYSHIMVITPSAALSPSAEAAQAAAVVFTGRSRVTVVDSLNAAVGLGLLCQHAAGAAASGAHAREVEKIVRAATPHVYTLFCIPELTCLASNGYLTSSQAMVGEMLGLFPIFVLEEGRLAPLEKVRTQRHLIESFQEFIDEFIDPQHIAMLNSPAHTTLKTKPLRQYVCENFPSTPFSEHVIGPQLAAVFGTQSMGLVIMEKANGSLP